MPTQSTLSSARADRTGWPPAGSAEVMKERNERLETADIEWRPNDAPGALRALELLSRRLRARRDRRAVFIDVYIVITRRVVGIMSADDRAGFLDPPWLSELTGRFAEEALVAALASLQGRPVRSAAWRFANHYAANRLTLPWQDAIMGVSAHINYDLPMVVYDYLLAEGEALDAARLERYRHDYMRVNKVLESCIPECLDLLVERYRCRSTRRLLRLPMSRPFVCHAIQQVLVRWRDRVWEDVLALLRAPDAAARRRIVERLDRRAGRIAQAVCSGPVLLLALRGHQPPFRLSRRAETWPGVDGSLGAEATITETVLAS